MMPNWYGAFWPWDQVSTDIASASVKTTLCRSPPAGSGTEIPSSNTSVAPGMNRFQSNFE